jgi:hypothetical protein
MANRRATRLTFSSLEERLYLSATSLVPDLPVAATAQVATMTPGDSNTATLSSSTFLVASPQAVQATTTAATPTAAASHLSQFNGTYRGGYSGSVSVNTPLGSYMQNVSGAVQFKVTNGQVGVQLPFSGSGAISADGSGSASGSGFVGVPLSQVRFTVQLTNAGRGAVGSGTWYLTGDSVTGSGSWDASSESFVGPPSPSTFNLKSALKTLDNNVTSVLDATGQKYTRIYTDAHGNVLTFKETKDAKQPIGLCARYVRLALEAGNIGTTGYPETAREYGSFLVTHGFRALGSTNPKPQKGDIVVIQRWTGADGVVHEDGHIAMFDGKKWVSDFKQKDFWGGQVPRNTPHTFYRLS